jgi:proteic killer suppression protein
MLVEFEDANLQRLYEDPDYKFGGQEVTKAFRKVVTCIQAAQDERDLYAMKSLHFEKLKGKRTGQRSLKLNDQWRLVIRLEARDEGKTAVIIGIEDYH